MSLYQSEKIGGGTDLNTDGNEHCIGMLGGQPLFQKCLHAVVDNPGTSASYTIDVTDLALTAYGELLMIDPRSFVILYGNNPSGADKSNSMFKYIPSLGMNLSITYGSDTGSFTHTRTISIRQNATGTNKLEYYIFVNYTKTAF